MSFKMLNILKHFIFQLKAFLVDLTTTQRSDFKCLRPCACQPITLAID